MPARTDIEVIPIPILLVEPSVQQLLDLVHDHPAWPVSALVALHPLNQNGTQAFSSHLVRAILTKLNLATAVERSRLHLLVLRKPGNRPHPRVKIHPEVFTAMLYRCQQKMIKTAQQTFSQQEKLVLLQQVLTEGKTVTGVCQEAHLSRKRWYKWLRRFQQAGGTPSTYLKLLPSGQQCWLDHPKLAARLLTIIGEHPEFGTVRLLRELASRTGEKRLKRARLAAFLNQRQLQTAPQRVAYARAQGNRQADIQTLKGVYTKLTPREKVALLHKVFAGQKATRICKEAHISYNAFYHWVKQYTATADPQALASQRSYPTGSAHPNFVQEAPSLILSVVTAHPEYGADRISSELALRAGKSLLQPGSIGQFLRSRHLSTVQKRSAYAAAQLAAPFSSASQNPL